MAYSMFIEVPSERASISEPQSDKGNAKAAPVQSMAAALKILEKRMMDELLDKNQ